MSIIDIAHQLLSPETKPASDQDGGVPPQGLRTALRVATAAWLLTSIVEFTVWLAIAINTATLDAPWWLFSTTVGGIIVGMLWAANEAARRAPDRWQRDHHLAGESRFSR